MKDCVFLSFVKRLLLWTSSADGRLLQWGVISHSTKSACNGMRSQGNLWQNSRRKVTVPPGVIGYEMSEESFGAASLPTPANKQTTFHWFVYCVCVCVCVRVRACVCACVRVCVHLCSLHLSCENVV